MIDHINTINTARLTCSLSTTGDIAHLSACLPVPRQTSGSLVLGLHDLVPGTPFTLASVCTSPRYVLSGDSEGRCFFWEWSKPQKVGFAGDVCCMGGKFALGRFRWALSLYESSSH